MQLNLLFPVLQVSIGDIKNVDGLSDALDNGAWQLRH